MNLLFLDIETKPMNAWVWGMWKQNVGINQIATDWNMLTWAAKWEGINSVESDALPFHKMYEDDPNNDFEIVKSIHHMLDAADVVVAHNADRFDIPKLNARFIYHDLPPPSPYSIVDTLKTAKKVFNFSSNKLDYLAQHFNLGSKMDTGGFELWEGCINGDMNAWDKMVEYNVQDVFLLEKVYNRMLPWLRGKANRALYTESDEMVCPTCGSKNLLREGHYYTKVGKYDKYCCQDCNSFSRGRSTQVPKEMRRNVLAPL